MKKTEKPITTVKKQKKLSLNGMTFDEALKKALNTPLPKKKFPKK